MKDAYSFDIDYEGAKASYNRMFVAYLRSFARMGVHAIPMRAETGPIGGDLSHEFIILAQTGESEIFCDKRYLELQPPLDRDLGLDDKAAFASIVEEWTSHYAATKEMHEEDVWQKVMPQDRIITRGIEVGHIFYFATKYSAPLQANVMDAQGKEQPVFMGSYGIGPSRFCLLYTSPSPRD